LLSTWRKARPMAAKTTRTSYTNTLSCISLIDHGAADWCELSLQYLKLDNNNDPE